MFVYEYEDYCGDHWMVCFPNQLTWCRLKEVNKSYLSLIIESFEISPINVLHAAGFPPAPLVWALVPEQSARPDTITHANKLSKHLFKTSEKRFHPQPQNRSHARKQSASRAGVINSKREWPHTTCRPTRLGRALLAVLSCYPGFWVDVCLALAGFLLYASFQRPDHSGQCGLMQLCWVWNLGRCMFLLLQDKKVFPDIALAGARKPKLRLWWIFFWPLCCVFSSFRSAGAHSQPAFRARFTPSHSFIWKTLFMTTELEHTVLSKFILNYPENEKYESRKTQFGSRRLTAELSVVVNVLANSLVFAFISSGENVQT